MARMPVPGEVIDEVFRVEAEIDSGNFGSVYKVHDLLEDRVLALKVLRPGVHDEGELRQRFEREARLIYSLQHKHIVRVHFYGETNSGLPYMAMEYLEGTDLRTLLHHHGSLNDALVRRITLETLSALDAAHNLGIIHRDLKPANIFLVKDGGKGHVKVLDFGFAKALDDESPLADITNAGTLVGTPAYMAPELVHKKRVGPQADIYAMGLIMAEMVKGEKIIEIDAVYDTILFQASPEEIRYPDSVAGSPFAEVIAKATKKSLKNRYRSAREFGEDLGGLPEISPVPEPERQKKAPVQRQLYITDAGDDDVTVPRSLGLPSESELATLMGKGPVIDSGEMTIERPPLDKSRLEPHRGQESTPRPSTGNHRAVRNTPGNQPGVKQATRERTPRPSPVGREAREREPSSKQAAVEREPRHVGEVEIDDLARTTPMNQPESRVPDILLGVFLGALLLGIVFIVLHALGIPLLLP